MRILSYLLLVVDNMNSVTFSVTQVPTDGEFSVMNYRMTQEFKPPFRVNALIEEAGSLKVRASFFIHDCYWSTV